MLDKRLMKKMAVLSVAIIIATTAALPLDIVGAKSEMLNMSYIYFGNSSQYIEQVASTQDSLNIISPNYFNIDENGDLLLTNAIDKDFISEMHNQNIQVIPFLSNHWDRELGRLALKNRENLVEDICEVIEEYDLDGINVDLENLTHSDRYDYVKFVKQLDRKLPSNKVISVAVAPNPRGLEKGWQGSYDYKDLARYSDYLVIMTYDESYPGGPAGPVASIGFVEESIEYALEEVASEKILLGIPFFGRFWNEEEGIRGQGISISTINKLIEEYDSEITFDKKKQVPKVTISIKEDDKKAYLGGKELNAGEYTIWYENDQSIKRKLRLVQEYDLKGTASWSLGQEDKSIWDYYDLWLNGQYFYDIDKHWANESILDMTSKGWVQGTSNVTFSPDESLTRAQAAVVLVRALELEDKGKNLKFKDIPDNYWAKEEINIASQHGIVKGYENGRFLPEKAITREEMAVILDRILSKSHKIRARGVNYKDVDNSRWSYESISKMTSEGIFIGFEDNTFRPTENITRGQMAALMDRISFYIEQ